VLIVTSSLTGPFRLASPAGSRLSKSPERCRGLTLDLVDSLGEERDHEAGGPLTDAGAQCIDLPDPGTGMDRSMDDQVTGLSIDEIIQSIIIRVADRDMIKVTVPLITVVEWWLAAAYTILL
jgi:hypothetical protein